jgi:septal ring factor EnvC (AmiA/AmiB activator)
LRKQLEERDEKIADAEKQIADTEKQIVDAEKKIADLERQLALRLQNSTTSSKPPSSDGLAGSPRKRGRNKEKQTQAGGTARACGAKSPNGCNRASGYDRQRVSG